MPYSHFLNCILLIIVITTLRTIGVLMPYLKLCVTHFYFIFLSTCQKTITDWNDKILEETNLYKIGKR